MKTRAIVFARLGPVSEGASARVVFAVPSHGTFLVDLHVEPLGAVAQRLGLARHEAFDWAAGDAGAACTLMEFPVAANSSQEPLPSTLELATGQPAEVRWLPFPGAVRALTEGTDRRYLQLAVQYISSGGVGDNLIAADADGGLLGQLGKALEEQTGSQMERGDPGAEGTKGETALPSAKPRD